MWISTGESGFWQILTYENLPTYCRHCHCLSHDSDHCSPEGVNPTPKISRPVQKVWKPKQNPSATIPATFDATAAVLPTLTQPAVQPVLEVSPSSTQSSATVPVLDSNPILSQSDLPTTYLVLIYSSPDQEAQDWNW